MKATVKYAFHQFEEDRAAMLSTMSEKGKAVISTVFPTKKAAFQAMKDVGMTGKNCAWYVSASTKPILPVEVVNKCKGKGNQ